MRNSEKTDIMNCTLYFLNYVIKPRRLMTKLSTTGEKKTDCLAMRIWHEISDIMIGGVKIPFDQICLNYD